MTSVVEMTSTEVDHRKRGRLKVVGSKEKMDFICGFKSSEKFWESFLIQVTSKKMDLTIELNPIKEFFRSDEHLEE